MDEANNQGCQENQSTTRLFSVSEMARINNLTRTTLIYYDKIGLFRPTVTDEKGYRYYCASQIPLLKEICFLRDIGISIEDIKGHNEHHSSSYTNNLFTQQLKQVNSELEELQRRKSIIERRIAIPTATSEYTDHEFQPTIEYFPERYAVCWPWDPDNLTIHGLNQNLMKAWMVMEQHGLLPGPHWGSILFQKHLHSGNPLQEAVSCAFLPEGMENRLRNLATAPELLHIPAGYYACIYKYAMPFQMEPNWRLMEWVAEQGFEVCGDLVDVCLLDSIFYRDETELDFCQIQIPINYQGSLKEADAFVQETAQSSHK